MRLTLNGYVAEDDELWVYEWFGYTAFSPATVRQALQDCPADEELILEINSPGGSVFAGNEMYSVLRAARGERLLRDNVGPTRIRAEIQSIAASAASYFCLGCDEVWISPVAQMMIHLPAFATRGDYHDHEHGADVLRSIGESLLNAYELRCAGKASRETLTEWMEKETWLNSQQAVSAGLCDGILYMNGEAPLQLPENMSAAIASGIRIVASCGAAPDLQQLRAKAEREKALEAGHKIAATDIERELELLALGL